MAVASGNSATVSSATTSDWVKLARGKNRIYVSCATWSTTSVTMQTSNDASTVYTMYRDDFSTAIVANSTTGNLVFDVDGPGYLRMNATAYASNAVTMVVTNPVDDRL